MKKEHQKIEDENQLIENIKNGNKQLFSVLMNTYKDRIYSLCLHYTKDNQIAEDATQDIFITAFEKLYQFRGDAQFGTWLYRIAINKAIFYRKKYEKEINMQSGMDLKLLSSNPSENPEFQSMEQEKMKRLHDAIQQISSPKIKTILWLRFFERLPLKEIAQRMDVTEGTIKTQLFRGIQKLRNSALLTEVMEEN